MKYEYLVIKAHEDIEKREFAFNALGDEGWELVCFDQGVSYFKRPILGSAHYSYDYHTIQGMTCIQWGSPIIYKGGLTCNWDQWEGEAK